MKIRQIFALLTASALLLCGCHSSTPPKELTYTDVLFDTVISVQIMDTADSEIIDGCAEICRKYDVMFSRTNANSEISKINSSKGEPVEVSKDTIDIIERGIYYSKLSEGAFDITIGTVTNLWDFKSENHIIPSNNDINLAVSNVNYENIILNGNTVQLTNPNMMLDVGALAKGYIADRLKDYLLENNIQHALINLGGNVLAVGNKPDGTDFNIGIQKPFDETGLPITSVKLNDQTVVTTGIYQRYFEIDDVIYHHILDPGTGYPCNNDLYSVSIITDSSLDADALSTSTFLLGFEKGMELINSLDNVEAIFITSDMEIHYSDNL